MMANITSSSSCVSPPLPCLLSLWPALDETPVHVRAACRVWWWCTHQATSVLLNGSLLRFCFQHGKLEPLESFDGLRRCVCGRCTRALYARCTDKGGGLTGEATHVCCNNT